MTGTCARRALRCSSSASRCVRAEAADVDAVDARARRRACPASPEKARPITSAQRDEPGQRRRDAAGGGRGPPACSRRRDAGSGARSADAHDRRESYRRASPTCEFRSIGYSVAGAGSGLGSACACSGVRRPAPRSAARDGGGAEDDAAEGDEAERAEHARRRRLVVDQEARGDRERVRAERRQAGGRERAAALERELDEDEREAVAGPDRQRRRGGAQPPCTASFVPTSAAAYMSPAAIPKPAPGARRGAAGPIATADGDDRDDEPGGRPRPTSRCCCRSSRRRARPRGRRGRRPRGRRRATRAAGAATPSARCARTASRREPAGRDRLDERERREPERDDVERPAARSRPGRRTASAGGRRGAPSECHGCAERELRQLRGDRVLGDPRPVERGRSDEGEDQPQDRGGAHLDRSSGVRAHRRATPDPGHSTRLRRESHPSRRRFRIDIACAARSTLPAPAPVAAARRRARRAPGSPRRSRSRGRSARRPGSRGRGTGSGTGARAVVPLVEPLRVDAVQPVHQPGHRVAAAFEDGVEVVRHQAERRARELVLERQTPQRVHERQAIVVVEVDQAAVDAARGGVEAAVRRKHGSGLASDGLNLARPTSGVIVSSSHVRGLSPAVVEAATAGDSPPPWPVGHGGRWRARWGLSPDVADGDTSGDCPQTWPKRTGQSSPWQ